MAGPQFVRYQTFSQKTNKGGQSVAQVVDEVEREPEFCTHVETPKPPNQLYGVKPRKMLAMHDDMLSKAKTKVTLKNGKVVERGIRKDRHTLLGIVASHPYTSRMVKNLPDAKAEYEDWRDRTIAWLKEQHGDNLVSVVEHLDEEHPHIHGYVLPLDDPNCSARALNPAYVAKEEVEAAEKAKGTENREAVKLGNNAYKEAARKIQDDYHQKVGQYCAMTRTGPKRRRLSRQQWKAEKVAAERAKAALTLPERVEAAIALVSATEAPRAPVKRMTDQTARKCVEKAPVPLWGDHERSLGPLAPEGQSSPRKRQIQIRHMSLDEHELDDAWRQIKVPDDLSIFDAARWFADFDQRWVAKAQTLVLGQELSLQRDEQEIEGLIQRARNHLDASSTRHWPDPLKEVTLDVAHISHMLEAFREIRHAIWNQIKAIIAPQISMGQQLAKEFEREKETLKEVPVKRPPSSPSMGM